MKRLLIYILLSIGWINGYAQQKEFADILTSFTSLSRERVMVVAHRGDWRNAPENSLQSLENVIKMGTDVYELDLKKSKDGHLVLMHDKTIDRTMNGKGTPGDFTLAELKEMRLKNGLGRPTFHQIPTFEEFLRKSKDRILVDVDKGYDYFPEVIKLLQKHGMQNQAIINIDSDTKLEQVEQRFGKVPLDIILMPIINLDNDGYRSIIDSYRSRKNTIFQPVFKTVNKAALEYVAKLRTDGYHVWLNSLWPSLNAGHDDDTAVELNRKDETWGWLIKQGATLIQTDRPKELIEYLRKKE